MNVFWCKETLSLIGVAFWNAEDDEQDLIRTTGIVQARICSMKSKRHNHMRPNNAQAEPYHPT